MRRPLTEAEAKAARDRESLTVRRTRRAGLVYDSAFVEAQIDRAELEALTAAQSRAIYTLRRQLRRLRDIHRAADFIRTAAREHSMDSVTLSCAFYDWLGGLSQDQLDQLRTESVARKRGWAGPL